MKTKQILSVPLERVAERLAASRHYAPAQRDEALASLGASEDALLETTRVVADAIAETLGKGDPTLLLRFARAYFRTERRLYLRAPQPADLTPDATLVHAEPRLVPVPPMVALERPSPLPATPVGLAVPTYLYRRPAVAAGDDELPMTNAITEESIVDDGDPRPASLPFTRTVRATDLEHEPHTLRQRTPSSSEDVS